MDGRVGKDKPEKLKAADQVMLISGFLYSIVAGKYPKL